MSVCVLLLLACCATWWRDGGVGGVWGQFTGGVVDFSTQTLHVSLDINITFIATRNILPGEAMIVYMPRFTRRLSQHGLSSDPAPLFNIPLGQLIMSPSINFVGGWTEGVNHVPSDVQQDYNSANASVTPFSTAHFTFMAGENFMMVAGTTFTFAVYAVNGIAAYCGFPGSIEISRSAVGYMQYETRRIYFQTNLSTALYPNLTAAGLLQPLTDVVYLGFGPGCAAWNDCNGHGSCDYCLEKCHCYPGYGKWNDTVTTGRNIDPSCQSMVCPAGKSIADIPTAANKAHALAECSDRGLCDRKTGQCTCFPPFTGGACERLACPNSCSGHGQCLSMRELSIAWAQRSPSYALEYGGLGYMTTAWDYDVMHGCLCDSAWPVGYEAGQYQLGEYFGPDCSLRRCPTGNNPYSNVYQMDCFLMTQFDNGTIVKHGGRFEGRRGNLCLLECSGRGVCDHRTGACKCFQGSWGDACDQLAGAGNYHSDYTDWFLKNASHSKTHNISYVVEAN
jgi:hypothetical protein